MFRLLTSSSKVATFNNDVSNVKVREMDIEDVKEWHEKSLDCVINEETENFNGISLNQENKTNGV